MEDLNGFLRLSSQSTDTYIVRTSYPTCSDLLRYKEYLNVTLARTSSRSTSHWKHLAVSCLQIGPSPLSERLELMEYGIDLKQHGMSSPNKSTKLCRLVG
ncbi:hypothetical protein TNCV_2134181 [Trichonephila clavipes]|nr:hypothetical protein TNCV_2134181 [Trichonephila clavipes]